MRWFQDDRATFPFDNSLPPVTLPDSTVAREVRALVSSIRAKVENARATGELAQQPKTYLVKKVVEIHEAGSSSTRSLEHRMEWDRNSVWNFRMKEIQSTPEFDRCKEAISRQFQGSPDAFYCVLRLADETVHCVLEGLSQNREQAMIATFLGDLEHADRDISVTCGIEGVSIESCEELPFGLGKIRRVLPADLSAEQIWNYDPRVPSYGATPSAMVELYTKGTDINDGRRQMAALLNCLRLFRLGSVREIWLRASIQSVVHVGTLEDPMSNTAPKFKLAFTASDEDSLRAFIARFNPLVLDITKPEKPPPVRIALQRYIDGVSLKLQTEPRITLGTTTLEALFCTADEKTEINYRLSLRVAAVLQTQPFNALEVRKDIKSAYTIRSKYVHGSLSPDGKSKNDELCARLLEYARLCVQICLQLHNSLGKNDLIALLDTSFVDANARNELRTRLLACYVTR